MKRNEDAPCWRRAGRENENPVHTGRWSGANQRRPHAVSPLFYYYAYSRRAEPFPFASLSPFDDEPNPFTSSPNELLRPMPSQSHAQSQPIPPPTGSLFLFAPLFYSLPNPHTGIDHSLHRRHLSPQLMVGRLPIYSALPSTRTNYHQRMTMPPFV